MNHLTNVIIRGREATLRKRDHLISAINLCENVDDIVVHQWVLSDALAEITAADDFLIEAKVCLGCYGETSHQHFCAECATMIAAGMALR